MSSPGLKLFFALTVFAGTAQAQIQSDWERANEERIKQSYEKPVAAPPFDRSRLVEVKLSVSASTDFRYYVDWGSVSAGEDRIVRYALLARSPSGAENVSFEGIRCQSREYRVYAVGEPGGGWGGRATEWRPIPRTMNSSQAVLAKDYFCPGRAAIKTSEEGQRAVRAGGHPGVLRE